MFVPKWFIILIPALWIIGAVNLEYYVYHGGHMFNIVIGVLCFVVSFAMLGGELIFQRQRQKKH